MSALPITEGPYGFTWGPIEVQRAAEYNGNVALDIYTNEKRRLTIYVSPTGRSVRVFGKDPSGSVEWKPLS